MLAIKYHLTASPAAAATLLPAALPTLMRAMHEDDDDVRAAAAQACVPVVSAILVQGPQAVRALLESLWAMLPALDDLSAATSSAVQLLSMLYTHDSAGASPQTSGAAAAAPAGPKRAAAQRQHAGVLDTTDAVAAVQARMHTLWPLFVHPLLDVRVQVLKCCRRISVAVCARAAATSAAVDVDAAVRPLLRLAFQTLLTSSSDEVCTEAEELLTALCQVCPAPVLAAALDATTLQYIAALPCMPAATPLPAEYLFLPPLEHRVKCARECTCAASASTWTVAGNAEAGLVAHRRVRYAHALAGFAEAFRGCASDATATLAASNMQNLMGTYLLGQSAEQQTFAAMVLLFWLLPLQQPSAVLPDSVREQVRHTLRAHATKTPTVATFECVCGLAALC